MSAAEASRPADSGVDYALLVQQEGKSQSTLGKFISLMLSYRYGIQADVVPNYMGAAASLRSRGKRMRCVFVIQDKQVSARTTVPALSLAGTIPLYLVLPGHMASEQRQACEDMPNVYICPWETAFTQGDGAMPQTVAAGMMGNEADAMFSGEGAQEALEERVRARLENLDTLPTLPAVVMHIMRLIGDPTTTIDQLEELLLRDPAIVLKVLQVASSPVFAGAAKSGKWTLKEAIVRLGLRKVGAIAQQIALINTFVRPEDSEFDLQRFWQHSVGCAMVADRLVEGQHLRLNETVEFNEYWIAALLHDAGKLVQGFFYHDWFLRIQRTATGDRSSYHAAESEMADGISHELIGELLLAKSTMPPELIQAVRLHHATGNSPGSLVSLVNVADNLTKGMGLGYAEKEPPEFSRPALSELGLKRDDARKLTESLGESIVGEVRHLVEVSLSGT